jgi:glycosyltransferase involved in cell wall biosynthesis
MKSSVVICAYNEDKTIRDVLVSVSDCKIFDEIIVVNDGSVDNTKEIIIDCKNELDIIDIHLPENKGKGFAMATGIEHAGNELIVFCDADLSNLKREHFLQLIKPIIRSDAKMVLGQPTETLINYYINPFKIFTGQRAVLRIDVLPIVEEMKTSKFGVETLINLYYEAQNKKVKHVKLKGLKHPTKFKKTNQSRAVKAYLFEGIQIALIVFNNLNSITKIIINRINNL